jgi:hypothetical protein
MVMPGTRVLWLVGLLLISSTAAAQHSVDDLDAKGLFFEGLDMREAGDCEGAIGRFQLALARDPALHQARLHVAECFHELGMNADAIREAQSYLDAGFEMAEVGRACALIVAAGGEACAEPDNGAAEVVETGATPEPPPPSVPPATGWTVGLLEAGVAATHYANSAGLTAVGPLVGVQISPLRPLQFSVRARLGFATYIDEPVQVPDLGVGVAGVIPIGQARLALGVVVPMVFSGFDEQTRVDVGILGAAALRVLLGTSRLVVGAGIEGGYLVTATLGGSIRLGVLLGPRGGGR